MLTPEERRDKAHKHFIATWGEEQGTKMWEDYCRKSGLLPPEPEPEPKVRGKKKGSGK